MDAPPSLLDLPVEILLRCQRYAGNFAQQRLVCGRMNSVASVLLLQRTMEGLGSKIVSYASTIAARVEHEGDRMGETRLQQMLDDVQVLNSMKDELEHIGNTVREKNDSLVALNQPNSNLSDKSRATLLKLCDLHPEFLSISAVNARTKDIALRAGILSVKRPLLADDGGGLRVDPLRVHRPPPPRNPYGPDVMFDPFAREPDPDHMRPPGFDEDDDRDLNPFPVFPGQPFPGQDPNRFYPPGGVRPPPGNFPPAGGRGGAFPPGYNPDFDRDLNPLGPFGPQGGPGNRRPPTGPFNPGGGFGGGFGGPRFL